MTSEVRKALSLISSKRTTIKYLDALCGAGKTTVMLNAVLEQARRGQNILIVQPSVLLIEESYKAISQLNKSKILITRIHSESILTYESVGKSIIDHLKKQGSVRQVLFITHKAFMDLPYFDRSNNWRVVVDEIPQAVELYDEILNESFHNFSSAFDVQTSLPGHYLIKPGDRRMLRRISLNASNDAIFKVLQPLAKAVLSKHHDVYVRQENWIRTNQPKLGNKEFRLTCHLLLRPSIFDGFKDIVLMGALFKETLLYNLWKEEVAFIEEKQWSSKLRYSRHSINGSLELRYFTEFNWTKDFNARAILTSDQSVLSLFIEKAGKEVGKEAFVYCVNKDSKELCKELKGILLTGMPHGLNTFQHIHKLVFLSALNAAPVTYSFLKQLGCDSFQIKRQLFFHPLYQAVMRISLRDPRCKDARIVWVPNRESADWLANLFDNCKVESMNCGALLPRQKRPGRPKSNLELSDAERKRLSRRKKLISDVYDLPCNAAFLSKNTMGINGISGQKNNVFEGLITVSLFDNIYSAPNRNLVETFPSEVELREFLFDCSGGKIAKKTDGFLISTAVFGSKTTAEGLIARTKDNVEYIWGIWLDFDGGKLTKEDFAALFPSNRLYIFNTFSGGGRYRVLMPTSHYLTIRAYDDVLKSISNWIESSDAKYISFSRKNRQRNALHGLDKSKLHAASLFYAPSQAREPSDSFAVWQDGEAFDVISWLMLPLHSDDWKQQPSAKRPGSSKPISLTPIPNSSLANQIEAAVQKYEDAPCGQRHNGFLSLAGKLKAWGFGQGEIYDILSKADYDGSRQAKGEIDAAVKFVMSKP